MSVSLITCTLNSKNKDWQRTLLLLIASKGQGYLTLRSLQLLITGRCGFYYLSHIILSLLLIYLCETSLENSAPTQNTQYVGTFTCPTSFPHFSLGAFINKLIVQLYDKLSHKRDHRPRHHQNERDLPPSFGYKAADIMSTT